MSKTVVLQSLALFTCGILVGSFLFSRWKHGGLPTAAAMEQNATKDPRTTKSPKERPEFLGAALGLSSKRRIVGLF